MYVQEGTFEVASPELTGLLRDRSRPSVPSIGQVPRPDRADAGAVGPPQRRLLSRPAGRGCSLRRSVAAQAAEPRSRALPLFDCFCAKIQRTST